MLQQISPHIVIILFTFVSLASSDVYHIAPSDRLSLCESIGMPCMSLEGLGDVGNVSTVTIVFLPGKHFLTRYISIVAVNNVTLIGDETQLSTINYQGISGFGVRNCSILFIGNLNMERSEQMVFSVIETTQVFFIKCKIDGTNHSKARQPSVYVENARTMSISHSIFENNLSSGTNGTALSMTHIDSVSILGSSFINNHNVKGITTGAGGGVYLESIRHLVVGNCSMNNNSVHSNYAKGGALFIQNAANVRIKSTLFKDNRVTSFNSNSETNFGGAVSVQAHSMIISGCQFLNNKADYGGALYLQLRILSCVDNIYVDNIAYQDGGAALMQKRQFITLSNENYKGNRAYRNGGAIYLHCANVNISGSYFSSNIANQSGGAIHVYRGEAFESLNNTFISNSAVVNEGGAIKVAFAGKLGLYNSSNNIFCQNSAGVGGAIHLESWLFFNHSGLDYSANDSYINNTALTLGGAVCIQGRNMLFLRAFFTHNGANKAAALYYSDGDLMLNKSVVTKNNAPDFVVLMVFTAGFFTHDLLFSENNGSLQTLNCVVKFDGVNMFLNNNGGSEGGAYRSLQSDISFDSTGTVTISGNSADNGGGMMLVESHINISCNVNITQNTAKYYGGGIYAYLSELYYKGITTQHIFSIDHNTAVSGGGGLLLIASRLVNFRGTVKFHKNSGLNGGALLLKRESRFYVYNVAYNDVVTKWLGRMDFSENSADLGGAVYVDDGSTRGAMCEIGKRSSSEIGCFVQGVIINNQVAETFLLTFTNNTGATTGNDIYGGLLDRCSHSLLELYDVKGYANVSSLDFLLSISTFNHHTGNRKELREHITSKPVQLCFCTENNTYNCTVMSKNVYVKRGELFKVKVTAVDQLQNQVDAIVQIKFTTILSANGQLHIKGKQNISSICTDIEYSVAYDGSWAETLLFPHGPCDDKGISSRAVNVTFSPCTCRIGFEPSESTGECRCDCAPQIKNFANCLDNNQGTIELLTSAWVGYVNKSLSNTGPITYPCPFDYCLARPVNISFDSPHNADQQCAFNRSNLLCGECKQGLSLVFGSSRCKECPNAYLSLLLPFAIMGILLVVVILVINMTVAIGAVHGLIFYANIVSSAQPIFFTEQQATPFRIFIAWLNLDLGIETCFYDGMNSNTKSLLQLVFPSYLIFLTILIIVLCEYSQRFAALLGNKNPVATLCTLILLSFSKLLRTTITALQFGRVKFPDGYEKIVWLYDANVPYFQPTHAGLFFTVSSVIITLGTVYTILLLFGQWLPRFSSNRLMKWIRHPKYNAFIDAYHAPFTPKHRYWVGLLLLARIISTIVEAVIADESGTLMCIVCIVLTLLLLKTVNTRTYKHWALDFLENSFLTNLIVLSVGTYHVRQSSGNESALLTVSISTALATFLGILCFHMYKFVLKHTRCWNSLTQLLPRKQINHGYRLVPMADQDDDEDSVVGDVLETDQHNYTGDSTQSIGQPGVYDPPIIHSALILDQLREPDLDILDPITEDDYREVLRKPPPPAPRPVTCSIVERPTH